MTTHSPPVLNALQTAEVLPYPELVQHLIKTAREKAAGTISTPARQTLAYPGGGSLLSMPATASDVGAHKLVNIMPHNAEQGKAVIQGLVCAYGGHTGTPLFILDGPTVTERRTAAVSMMGLELLWQTPHDITIIGSGVQAHGHIDAILSLYPNCRIHLLARNVVQAQALQHYFKPKTELYLVQNIPASSDVVITTTSSQTPVYTEQAQPERFLIAVGAYKADMAEIHAQTIQSSRLFIDNPDAATHEAGDFIQANIDWNNVQPIITAQPNLKGSAPFVYKTIGCAAWDLAAVRCAKAFL